MFCKFVSVIKISGMVLIGMFTGMVLIGNWDVYSHGLVLIDLQKAFDTIGHETFLDKMASLGFSNSTISWFKSYLQDRSFTVNIGTEYSNQGNLSCGVPQGSILGPFIFLLYVNDMAQAVDCDLLLHADDSCLIFRDKCIQQIEVSLNRNFNTLCDWFIENKLSIHFGEDKTKSILFGRKICKNLTKLDIRNQCVCVNVMKFFNGTAPAYSAEIFHPANQGRIMRRSKFKSEFPFPKGTSE